MGTGLVDIDHLCRLLDARLPKMEDYGMTHRAHVIVFYVVSIGLLLGGGSLLFWPESWPLHEVVTTLAQALIVAGILSLVVDRFVKQHFLREVTTNAFHYLIGYDLPTQMIDSIKSLTRTTIVRSRFCLDYRFEAYEGEKLKGVVSIDYEVENYSTDPELYTPVVAVEVVENPTFLELGFYGPHNTGYSWDQEALKNRVRPPEKGSVQIYGEPLKVPPRKPGETYRVSCKYSIVAPQPYTDAFIFSYPTMDATVTASMPMGFTFLVSGTKGVGNRWHLDRLFLPGQGIRVRCFQEDKASSHELNDKSV